MDRMQMDTKSIVLNSQLANASKKFYKSCEQIKVIKQRIAELVGVFTYCEQEINRMNQSSSESSSLSTSTTSSPSSRFHLNTSSSISNTSSSSQSSTNASEFSDHSDELDYSWFPASSDHVELIDDDSAFPAFVNAVATDGASRHHMSAFRESIRQQIENLQCVKTAYFMYAHRKADEITRLQCELYGEDAVREAYELAEPDALLPNELETRQSEELTSEAFDRELSAVESDNGAVSRNQASSESGSASWSPWDFNNYYPFLSILASSRGFANDESDSTTATSRELNDSSRLTHASYVVESSFNS